MGDAVDKALALIETRLFEPLTLDALAEAAGLSPYHFVRVFAARVGESPVAHVRQRRMEAAARRLAGPDAPALVDLAFDCGFESQEAFTRAFKRTYGVPPGRFREINPRTTGDALMSAIEAITPQLEQLPDVRRPAFRVAGVSGVFSHEDKSGIPGLWPRLISRLPLAGQAGFETYGVCSAADAGSMTYMAGVRLAEDAPPPPGLETVEIAPQTYLVFRQTLAGGELQPQLLAGVKRIWGELIPASGRKLVASPDFELYPDDFDPGRAGSYIDIYIPVEA